MSKVPSSTLRNNDGHGNASGVYTRDRRKPRLCGVPMRPALYLALLAVSTAGAFAQSPTPGPEFDVVSIKPNTSGTRGGSARTLPDGTSVLVNQPIYSIILGASPVQTREVVGLPDWVTTERYDITLKPPPGGAPRASAAGAAERRHMMLAMFRDRMKLVAHVEQRERDVYSLVIARSDGRLGPELKPSTLDCSPATPGTPPPPLPPAPSSPNEMLSRCGMMVGSGRMVSGGMPLNNLAGSLYGLVGGEVENQTGLAGFYSINLTYAPRRGAAAPLDATVPADEAPDIFTAVQEQLGLKLVAGKKMMPVFVVDHIERPTDN
jgi:uncharacterized protein (TIGR03435 family)